MIRNSGWLVEIVDCCLLMAATGVRCSRPDLDEQAARIGLRFLSESGRRTGVSEKEDLKMTDLVEQREHATQELTESIQQWLDGDDVLILTTTCDELVEASQKGIAAVEGDEDYA